MEKKLIFKLKRNKEDKDLMLLQTENEKYDIAQFEEGYVLLNIFELLGVDFNEIDKIEEATSLNSLIALINRGFSIRIDSTEQGYILIVSREKCSKSFNAKEFSKLMIEAENWAQTLIEEIKNCCNLKNI